MPYEYYDRFVFDCWATYGNPAALRLFKFRKLDEDGHVQWSAHDEEDHHIFAFEVRDALSSERLGSGKRESGTGPILLNWPAQPTSERSSPGGGILISAHLWRATRGTIGRL